MWGFLSFLVIIVSVQAVLALPVPKKRSVAATTDFAADPSINTKAIFTAAKGSGTNSLANFLSSPGGSNIDIFGDWLDLVPGTPIFQFVADMDVDCDGIDYKCKGNPDGQPQTSFGKLDASKVPFFVIPETFYQAQKSKIKPNSLGAIVCGGQMFYGIFGDTNGDSPEVIGEASILMAQTCFPNEGLAGNQGHAKTDVLYIHFGNQVPTGVGESTIDIAALKTLGDEQTTKLAQALGV